MTSLKDTKNTFLQRRVLKNEEEGISFPTSLYFMILVDFDFLQ